jgi:flavodoxin
MKIAVIYYSRTGNTKQVAQQLEEKLKLRNRDVDVIEIQAVKKPGFFSAGSAAMKQKDLPIKNSGFDLKPYDTLLVGSPTWAGQPSPFIKTFFSSAKNAKGRRTALFIIGGGKLGTHANALATMKNNLEQTGVTVADAFLELQMNKGTIVAGEQDIDGFLEKAVPL